ncbi:peroxide stress protein YaaA [Arenicella xantha]|uniref:UPF0246 protein DFR28_10896 n=1 Tax=Arenicella xantha TaxID=644221 RepID=A0A395JG88_9GAMM|nr:peroxide stress protein YaaA [Arenicella xantha]RBP48367.1 hypothetical protein DFR28_10896 [Arenicella xantha]
MLTVISPAKKLDFEKPSKAPTYTQPAFLDESEKLIDVMSTQSPADLEKLMHISPALAELNVERVHQWSRPFNKKNAKQAVNAFQGDVYVGLDADSFSDDEFLYAQMHLRILSGLYGVLRPLDLMQPYRLEMGTKLANDGGKNLYEFWGNKITENLNDQLQAIDSKLLLNLASNEYFRSVKRNTLNAEIVTPVFKDWKNDQYKVISFFAKKARGLMTAWVIKNQIKSVDALLGFAADGYQYSAQDSDANTLVFLRKQ